MYLKLQLTLLILYLFCVAVLGNNWSSPIISRRIEQKRFNGIINSTESHVWYMKLEEKDVDDIYRIRCSILRPSTKRTFGLHYLQVAATNGRDGVSFSLPEQTRSGIIVNETTRLLNPIKFTDVRNSDRSDQYLTIQISTRATINFTYEILYDRVDQSQYIVKLKEHKTIDTKQKFGFQRPLGFQIQNNNAEVLRISVKSEDELCGVFVMTDNERSIYESTGEISTSDRSLRIISFTTRMDIILLKEQIPENLYMYYIGQPDDNICYEDPHIRKNLAENKDITIHYSAEAESSYFTPISLFLLVFLVPPVAVLVYGWRSVGTSNPPKDSLSANSTTFQNESFNQDTLSNGSHGPVYYPPIPIEEPATKSDWKIFDVQFVLFIIPALLMNGFHIYRIIHDSNMDERCFHNFACAKPYGFFISFNHMISNCGYIINGLLYMLFVRMRRDRTTATTGVKNNYFIEICIGLSLICEGLASAFYHVCPSRDLYHFDTPFIQVICILIMLKLYGNRRRVITATIAYRHIAAILSLDVIVTVFDAHKWLRVILVSAQCSVILYVFKMISSYYDAETPFIGWLNRNRSTAIVVIVNLIISGLSLFFNDYIETDQFVTFLCAVNMILYLLYYSGTKLQYSEKLGKLTKSTLGISLLLWGLALYSFLQDETSWALTPAQSRALNKDCRLFNFYDYHDIWHLLSAEAIFATLVAVSTMDDHQATRPFEQLEKF